MPKKQLSVESEKSGSVGHNEAHGRNEVQMSQTKYNSKCRSCIIDKMHHRYMRQK